MKKFLLKLSLFIALLIIADIALGGVYKLFDYTKSGEIHRIHSIMTYQTPDLLILGSSRAVHHYDPSILEDTLGLKTFNAGVNGQGITIAYGLLQGISQRKFPKFILCEITPQYDLYDSREFVDVSILYPYIKNPNIIRVLN